MSRDYDEIARRDAAETVDNFLDEIVEQLLDGGEASNDLYNDYPNGDAYHHERHVDSSYSLLEAAELLDQLSEHVETDYGLWDRQEPRDAIATQAAYTYGNAVMYHWQHLIRGINDDDQIATILNDAREDEMDEKKIAEMVGNRVKEICVEYH